MSLLNDYTVGVTSATPEKIAVQTNKLPPYTFVMGQHEAAEEFCRLRGVHPAMFKPVVCWPNLTGYGVKHGYTLWLVRGWSKVEDYEKILARARLFGFTIKHA